MTLLETQLDAGPVSRKRSAPRPLDVRFEMRLDIKTHARLVAQAKRLGMSLAAYLRMAGVRQAECDEADETRNQGDSHKE